MRTRTPAQGDQRTAGVRLTVPVHAVVWTDLKCIMRGRSQAQRATSLGLMGVGIPDHDGGSDISVLQLPVAMLT